MMRRLRLSDVLRSREFQGTGKDFRRNAVANPFDKDGMDDFVRNRGARQGLDKVSRAHTGPDSGVNASRYDDMVRDFDDLDYDDVGNAAVRSSNFDYRDEFDDDEDDLFLNTKDRSYKQNEFDQERDIDDFEADAGWEFMRDLADMHEDDEELEPEDSFNHEAGDYEGVVRSVKGAYLVSKKQQPDNTYTEVWIYNVGDKFDDEANIRNAILSATDIDPKKNFSEDGSQEAVLKTIGNVQYLTITGMPD